MNSPAVIGRRAFFSVTSLVAVFIFVLVTAISVVRDNAPGVRNTPVADFAIGIQGESERFISVEHFGNEDEVSCLPMCDVCPFSGTILPSSESKKSLQPFMAIVSPFGGVQGEIQVGVRK
jgi:hypothetical protein